MSNSAFQAGRRGLLALLVLGAGPFAQAEEATGAPPPEASASKGGFLFWGAEPTYVETAPKRGFHLFLRPMQKNPEAQWAQVQALEQAGKTRAAAKQALALRIWWPNSPEAPQAQMLHARLMERRHHLQDAFDSYQYLIEHYAGRFEFNAVLERQLQIAKTLMDRKKGRFLFFPGYVAPEQAVPLFEKIVASAPEGSGAAEALYLTGAANERVYEYDKAIEAYFSVLNRFPNSEFAPKAAYAQARCHVRVADDSPNDTRALETARAACQLFLQRHPDSADRAAIEADLARLRSRQAANAYELARYYDRILRKPQAALIEYRNFVALFPNDARTPAAKLRIAELSPAQEN